MEVFRLTTFDKNKCYYFALKTKTTGVYPDEKHYSNELRYVGRYTHSEFWGFGDGASGAEYFNDNGIVNRIEYDYEGNTCFKEA